MAKLLYFARLRETLGVSGEELELSETVVDVKSLIALLRQRGGAWETELAAGKIFRIAINQEMAEPDSAIRNGDEIAIFPPVTGG